MSCIQLWELQDYKAPFIWCRRPETTLPRVAIGEQIFHLFHLFSPCSFLQRNVYMRITILVSGRRDNSGGELSHLGRTAGRVTLAGGTTFSHINTLSPLTETTYCVCATCHVTSGFWPKKD